MRWAGYTRTSPVDPAPGILDTAINTRLAVEGEVRNRRGMARSSLAKISGAVKGISDFAFAPGLPYAVVLGNGTIDGDDDVHSEWGDAQLTALAGFSSGSGTAFTITVFRNGCDFADGAFIFGDEPSHPTDTSASYIVGFVALDPGENSAQYSWTASFSGAWKFRIYGRHFDQIGPGANCVASSAQYLIASESAAYLGTSIDGVTWSSGSSFAGLTGLRYIGWFPSVGRWLVTSGTGGSGGACRSSEDGLTWSTVTTGYEGAGNRVNSIYYRSSTYFALGFNPGGGYSLRTSTDLTTWTTRATGLTQAYEMADDGTTLAVVGYLVFTYQTKYSTDNGVTWQAGLAAAPAPMTTMVYAPAAGLFVTAGGTAGTGLLYTSPDGITWTSRAAPESNTLQQLAYGNGVIVLTGAISGNVYTSTDGINYTLRTTMTGATACRFLSGSGIFAVGDSIGRVSFSDATGVTWSTPVLAGVGGSAISSIGAP